MLCGPEEASLRVVRLLGTAGQPPTKANLLVTAQATFTLISCTPRCLSFATRREELGSVGKSYTADTLVLYVVTEMSGCNKNPVG